MGGDRYLDGYDGAVHLGQIALVALRVAVALYLLASVLARYEARPIRAPEVALRLILAVLVLMKAPWLSLAVMAAAVALIGWHWIAARASARA